MTNRSILELLKSSGYYITDGHFNLVSRKHSDAYVQVRLSLMEPKICKVFQEKAINFVRASNPSAVAGFTIGGLLLAEAVTKHLRLPLLIGKKTSKGIEWVNEELLTHKKKLILVDDIFTTASQIQLAISSLEGNNLVDIVTILIAVNRNICMPKLFFRGVKVPIYSCVNIPITVYNPSTCPICRLGVPPMDLSDPETNVISVLLSQPSDKADFIIKGYEKVYMMQDEKQRINEIKALKPWFPVLIAGLPMIRMEEDNRLIRFISHLTSLANEYRIKPQVLSEIVGQLLSLCSIRVESRSIGCSLLVGDNDSVEKILESKARVKLPVGVSCDKLTSMVPYFDAFRESGFVMLLSNKGKIVDFKRLVYNRPKSYLEGIELIRYVTLYTQSIGFVLRKGRNSISVYWKGRLEVVGELSQRTGLWGFSKPMERIDELDKILPGLSKYLATLVEVGRELVAREHGALFVIGNIKDLKHTKPKVEIEPQPLTEIPIDDLVELAKLDGAVIINKEGKLVNATVIIQNRSEGGSKCLSESRSVHGGSRKETARRTSIECRDCVTIYVSQNGVIEVYLRGNSWPIAEAIYGLSYQ